MTTVVVSGGRPLQGSIYPSANKNAVLPALCASLLTEEPVTFRNVPSLTDVHKILEFFRALGSDVKADFSSGIVTIKHGSEVRSDIPLPIAMRSSVMLIPGLLHRCGVATLTSDSKGCTLGVREIDPHIEVFRSFGAEVESSPSRVVIRSAGAFRTTALWADLCAAIWWQPRRGPGRS